MSITVITENTLHNHDIEKAIRNHVMFTASDDMAAICQPLKQHLKIDYFLYQREQVDCNAKTQLAAAPLGNCPILMDFLAFSQNDYSPSPTIYDTSGKYSLGKCSTELRERFNVPHYLMKLTKIGDNLWEHFEFGISSSDISQLDIYFNNCDLLDRFIVYFRERAAKLIDTAWQTRFVFANPQVQHIFLLDEEQHYTQMRQNFLQNVEPHRYPLLNKQRQSVLVPKLEMRCLSLLGQGRSVKEIASILNISPRTVETYWQRSKIRLNCYTRKELLDLLSLNKEVF